MRLATAAAALCVALWPALSLAASVKITPAVQGHLGIQTTKLTATRRAAEIDAFA